MIKCISIFRDESKTVVDNFESLQEKYSQLESQIKNTEKDLKDAIAANQAEKQMQKSDYNDDLDSFMDQLQKTQKASGGKEHVSKLKQLLQSQQNELKRLEKLVKIAKPTQMPKLNPASKPGLKGVMIGKRWGFGGAKNLRTISASTPKVTPKSDEKIPEIKSNDDEVNLPKLEETDPQSRLAQDAKKVDCDTKKTTCKSKFFKKQN